jgi:hypothetical protein
MRTNQKRILARILKDVRLKDFVTKFKPFKPESKAMNDAFREGLIFLREFILLLANLSRDNKLGTLQVKRILSYAHVTEILKNQNTLYCVKKAYLRFLFQVKSLATLTNDFRLTLTRSIVSTKISGGLR